MKQMLQITPEGECKSLPNEGLDAIKAAIGGGWVEAIPLDHANIFYGDEEAKIKRLTPNLVATLLWHKINPAAQGDIICGSVVIVGILNAKGKRDGVDYDPTPDIVAKAKEVAEMIEPRIGVEFF